MNPAALKVNLEDLPPNGVLIVDKEGFTDANLKKAGYTSNPLTDHSLDKFQVFELEVSKLTTSAVRDLGLNTRAVNRCRNFFVLGSAVVAVPAPDPVGRGLHREPIQEDPRRQGGQPARLQGGFQLRRDHRDLCQLLRGKAGRDRSGLLSQHHRQYRHRAGLRGGGGEVRAADLSWAPTRSRRPAISCTNWRPSRTSRSTPSRPRTRSRASRRQSARLSAVRLR